jgi:Type II CAAX prenyl endopeptidase Rce1-like
MNGGAAEHGVLQKPGAWVDLGLTLPLFLVYHLGVVFLKVRNASDIVTAPLLELAEGNRTLYVAITCAIGLVFTGIFWILGRGQALRGSKFVQIVFEGVAYAALMGFATSYVVGHLFAANIKADGPVVGLVMSVGAGFYEELAFRVLLFGLGAKAIVWLFLNERIGLVGGGPRLSFRAGIVMLVWACACAAVFSGVHYVGAYGDRFVLETFVARAVLGLALTFIFVTRGFAAAAWAHALYDVWVLVL